MGVETGIVFKTVKFSECEQWDIKYFMTKVVSSIYDIQQLGKFIVQEKKKVKLFEYPNEKFKILGISNEKGMFDAYEELGMNINQSYIYVKNNCLAYNPYRINVGSIGMKTEENKNEYLSPAYVVFRCKENLLPRFLFILMKTNIFNAIIRENTTGSVRQTLSFSRLANIKIPIPDKIEVQKELVEAYESKMKTAKAYEQEAEQLEKQIDEYLLDILGIEVKDGEEKNVGLLSKRNFKDLFKWGVDLNFGVISPKDLFRSTKYENRPITSFCEINPVTRFMQDIEEVSFVPMECVSDIYGEIIDLKKGSKSLAKGYTRFQENDVIWAKITPCMQNGKSAVAKNLKNGFAYGSTEFHVFRAIEDKALPEYIHAFLRTRYIRKVAQSYFTGSSGQQRVGVDFIEALTLPLIPIKSSDDSIITQSMIVSHISKMKKKIKDYRNKAESLQLSAKQEFEEAVFND